MRSKIIKKTPGIGGRKKVKHRSNDPPAAPSYLGPLGVDEPGLEGVVQRGAVLAQTQVGGRAVAVQDAVLGVRGQGLAVEAHGQRVLPLLAGLVTAPHALQELGLAEGGGGAGAGGGAEVHRVRGALGPGRDPR